MTTSIIHIIGLGVAEDVRLSAVASQALADSTKVIGWQRHKALVLPLMNKQQAFCSVKKLDELERVIAENQETENKESVITIVASGDPLYYGIGRWMNKTFSDVAGYDLRFYPAVSSIQAACHQQALSLQDVSVISLHGRPLVKLRTALKKNANVVVLTDNNSQPQALAAECLAAGFEQSLITVHENLGSRQFAQSRAFSVADLNDDASVFDALHISIINVKGKGGVLPAFPGIPDHHYATGEEPGKGMISKREVRLAILSFMQAANDEIIWDIGAGCGGVAVELAYWNERTQVYAIECHPQRLHYLQDNRERFGVVQNLHVIEGRAPEILANLPTPDKVFIGGSDGMLAELLEKAWQALPDQGVLVASAVVAPSKKILESFALSLQPEQVECIELAVKRGHFLQQPQQEQKTINYVEKLAVAVFKLTKNSKCLTKDLS